MKCECPEEGLLNPKFRDWYDKEKELPFVNHAPHKCKCTNELAQYKRGDKIIWLCSCCKMFGDIRITQ